MTKSARTSTPGSPRTGARRVVINLFLLMTLLVLIGLHWFVLPDPSRRNYEFLPDMVDSPARDVQTPVAFEGNRIDFRPPEGSVARGFLPLAYAATPEGARQAAEELRNPLSNENARVEKVDAAAGDPEIIERGAHVFATFCAVCHGAGGHGDGPVTRRGVPPPPSLLAERARAMTDGQMYHVMSQGQGNMASYGSQVEREDRWKVILYIRTLQESEPEPEGP